MSEDAKLRDHLERRFAGLKSERTSWEGHWRDIATYCRPRRSRFLAESSVDMNRGDKVNTKIYDSHAIGTSNILANGMTSGLSSASRPWFKLAVQDEALGEEPGVKAYLADVEKAIYAFLAETNFYTASKTGYLELGLFGTEAAVMLPHARYGAVVHSLTVGEYWLGLDDANKPDTLYRHANMTVGQYCQRFPKDRWSRTVGAMYDRSDYDQWVPVLHAIEPNNDRKGDSLDRRNKPWRSVYWERGADGKRDNEGLIEVSGFDDQPFWGPRWETLGADVYGSSPGMDALPDVKELQLAALRKAQARDYLVRPALKGPPSLQNSFANLNPGGMTYVAAADDGSFSAVWKVEHQAITVLAADIADKHRSIDSLMFADLFMAITRMEGVQPRNVEELVRRNEEQMTQLGPVVERVADERLKIVIDRAYSILLRTGRLPEAPEALEGESLKIKFVSIMAQAQQLIGLGAIERTLGFAGNLVAAFPEAVDKIDADQAIDEYATIAGAPPRMIRSDEQVAQLRAERAQAQAAERAAAMMPAVKDGADAAQLLSQTDVGGGQSLLNQLMPA